MSEENKAASGPFDLATVKNLFELMDQFEVNEVDLRDGDKRIHLRKGALAVEVAAPIVHAAPAYAPAPVVGAAPPAAVASKYLEIKSPMVGTFYAKPSPDKDDYVKVGARVSNDTVVCKIEAMKIFNDLTADCSGTIVEILIQNSQPVEFDQVLFRVDPG